MAAARHQGGCTAQTANRDTALGIALGLNALFGAILLAGGAWLAIAYLPTVFPTLAESIERLSHTGDELAEGDLTGRTTIWGVAFDLFLERPILGIGTGAFQQAAAPEFGRPMSPHNTFLEAAVTNGLVGFLLFSGMFAIALVTVLQMGKTSRVYLLIALATLVVGSIPSNAYNAKHLWFLLALLAHQSPVLYLSASGALTGGRTFNHPGHSSRRAGS